MATPAGSRVLSFVEDLEGVLCSKMDRWDWVQSVEMRSVLLENTIPVFVQTTTQVLTVRPFSDDISQLATSLYNQLPHGLLKINSELPYLLFPRAPQPKWLGIDGVQQIAFVD